MNSNTMQELAAFARMRGRVVSDKTFDMYQMEAQRTSAGMVPSDKLENGILGLCGEAGECSDLLKKHLYQGHPFDARKLAEELGDVLWYCAEVAEGLNMSLGEIAEMNVDKLRKRYPDGFSAERSMNREDGAL